MLPRPFQVFSLLVEKVGLVLSILIKLWPRSDWLLPPKLLIGETELEKYAGLSQKLVLFPKNAPNILSGALQLKTFNLPHRSVNSTIIQLIKYRDIVNFTVKEWDSSIKYFKVWAISDSSILSKYKYLTEWECEIFHLCFIKYIIYVYFMFSFMYLSICFCVCVFVFLFVHFYLCSCI